MRSIEPTSVAGYIAAILISAAQATTAPTEFTDGLVMSTNQPGSLTLITPLRYIGSSKVDELQRR